MDEAEAVSYLLSNYPEWRKVYHLFTNHWAAMTVVAADFSKDCGPDAHADRLWIGADCEGLGMVFTGNSIGDHLRSSEDDQKLKKLEKRLVELELVTTPELDVLCSSSYLNHMEEPREMAKLPVPKAPWRIIELTKYWRQNGGEGHQRQEERKQKAQPAETR